MLTTENFSWRSTMTYITNVEPNCKKEDIYMERTCRIVGLMMKNNEQSSARVHTFEAPGSSGY